jgi:hypothetical protein
MGAITGLTKGLGKSIVDINTKAESIEKLMDPKALIDLSKIYKGKTFQNTYLKIFYQIKEKLLPATFLTASADFSILADEVFKEMNTNDLSFTEETKEKVRLDLLSYLTIKAYDNHMMNNNSRKVATLNNQILYPSRDSESVVDAAQRLFDWAEVNDPNNFFIMNFLDITKADNIDNTTGLNLAMANTFRQINSVQKLDLVNDFNKLYTNVQTKDDAQAIVNYIMVKDGLQLGYGSLLSAIAPQVLNDYLDQVDSVRKTLEGEVTFGTTFNSTQEELIEEFKVGYLTSNITGPLLPNLVRSELTMLPKPVKLKGDKLTIEFKDDASIKNYVRIANISELGGAIYKTYKANAEQDSLTIKYSEVPTYGSNQQTAIGFMFNTPEFSRPTYAENREYVKNKNNQTSEESKMDKMEFGLSEAAAIQQDVLNDTTNNIVATDKSVEANGINMADTDALMKNILEKSAAIENIESEINTLEDTENALPTIDVNEQGQYAMFAEDILGEASQFPLLSEGYANIMSNPSNKSIMMENKLFPFSNMISEYNDNFVKEKETEQENQEAFLDQLKCLGIK